MKKLQQVLTTSAELSLLLVVFLIPRSSVEAETLITDSPTGPSQATGPESATTRTSSPKSEKNLPKVRIDTTGLAANEVVAKLLTAMTLDEKIGQLCQFYPTDASEATVLAADDAQLIQEGGAGSIFFTASPEQTRAAQRVAVEESRLGIPLIVGRDVIHGFRTIFPIPIGQASSWNPALAEKAAQVAASEAKKVGIHWTFAPMIDIARDPRWGRIAESCGEDPVLTSALGVAMVRGFQSADEAGNLGGIAACAKHFAVYGLAEGGRDYNRTMVSKNELHNVYLLPFKACVDAGTATLMTSFNTVNGVPASGHEKLLRQILKGRWGFDGFVVSDWGSVKEMLAHGYSADERQAARQALQAGVDMEMVSTCYRESIPDLLEKNEIPIEMIDEAVRRILHVKLRLNLFNQPYADDTQPELLAESHLKVAREMAQQSVVLLKNAAALPLRQDKLKHVAVIGPFADAGLDQLGTWVVDAQASDSVTPLAALQAELGDDVKLTHLACTQTKYGESLDDVEQAIAAAKDADVVLLFVGEEAALSGEAHSRSNLNLPGSQSQLVESLGALDVPVVMIVLAGRPLTIGDEIAAVDAVLYAWHPGTMGGPALVDLLLGKVAPSGKLPVTFPKSVGQVPLYYNHPRTGRPAADDYRAPPLDKVATMNPDQRYTSHYVDSDPYPLFPFGFGLSYTTFEYQDLELSTQSIGQDQTLAVRVRLANTGQRAAVETVQLYVRDLVGSVVRPVKELKDFRRVALQPGESTVVEFALPYASLGFFNEEERYAVEPGEFEVSVGGSSDTPLSRLFSVE